MAVNENLYNWILKTYGMGAAEWYRSNPTKPSGNNPFLPKGAYVPLAQKEVPGAKGPRGETVENSIVSDVPIGGSFPGGPVYRGPDVSNVKPAPKAPVETEDQKFQRYYNQAKQKFEESQKTKPTLSQGLIPAYGQKNVYFDPTYGEYGDYVTKEDLGFNPQSALFKRYENAISNIPLRHQYDPLQMGHRALYGTSLGSGSEAGYKLVMENEADRQARAKAYENIYQTPLSQLPYKSYSEARQQNVSLEQYRADLAKLGLELPLMSGSGSYFLRRATPKDYEVQTYGIENVGRQDYRQNRANAAIAKNLEILQQQAASGNQSSQEFLEQYTGKDQTPETDEGGSKVEKISPVRGPRGENMGDVQPKAPQSGPKGEDLIARNQVSGTPEGPYTPLPAPGWNPGFIKAPGNPKFRPPPVYERILPDGRRVPFAFAPSSDKEQAPVFDEQKALIAAQAAGSYRKRGDVEDPFRSGTFG
jgi:hypothetical protein